MVPLTPFGSFSKQTTAPSRPQDGAKAFLVEEYKYLAYFVIGMAAVLALIFSLDTEDGDGGTKGVRIAAAFIIGAVLSAAAGWGGMMVATDGNVRTTVACAEGDLVSGSSSYIIIYRWHVIACSLYV